MSATMSMIRLGIADARARKLRSLLIGLLIALPVAVTSAVAIGANTYARPTEERRARYFGEADVVVNERGNRIGGDGEDDKPLPRFDHSEVLRAMVMWRSVGGTSVEPISVRSAPEGATLIPPMPVIRGRAARAADEVVISANMAEQSGLGVGDHLEMTSPALTATVTGVSSNSYDSSWGDADLLGVGLPLSNRTPYDDQIISGSTMADGDLTFGTVADSEYLNDGLWPYDERSSELSVVGLGLVGALIWTGLLAAAALSAGLRRRRRNLGLVGAAGATASNLRLAAVGEGLAIGLVAAIVGSALAAMGWVYVRFRTDLVGWDWLPMRIPWGFLVLTWCVGVGAAALAGGWAARGVANEPIRALLTGSRSRSVSRRTPGWVPALGFACASVIIALLNRSGYGLSSVPGLSGLEPQFTHGSGDQLARYWLPLVLWAMSLVLSVSWLVSGSFGRMVVGGRWGFVARDVARGGTRVVAVVSALAMTFAAGAAALVVQNDRNAYAQAVDIEPDPPFEALVLRPANQWQFVDGAIGLAPAPVDLVSKVERLGFTRLDRFLVDIRGKDLACADAEADTTAVPDTDPFGACSDESLIAAPPVIAISLTDAKRLMEPEDVAVLSAGGAVVGMLPDGVAWPLAVGGSEVLVVGAVGDLDGFNGFENAAVILVDTAEAGGFSFAELQPYWTSPRMSSEEAATVAKALRDDLRRLYSSGPTTLGAIWGDDTGIADPPNWTALLWIGAAVITQAVLAVALSLSRSEQAGDDYVLAAVGCSPRMMRSIAGQRAAWLVVLAGVAGVAYGLPIAAALSAITFGKRLAFPALWQVPVSIVGFALVAYVVFALAAPARPRRMKAV